MPKNTYKIAVIQLNLNNTPENNLEKCITWVKDAAEKGAEVISLPELYSSHYFCQSEDVDNFAYAEPLYSTSFDAFSELAKALGVVIIVPFFEKSCIMKKKLYNGFHYTTFFTLYNFFKKVE